MKGDGVDAAGAAVGAADADEDAVASYLDESSRLACQVYLRREDAGLVVALPDDVLHAVGATTLALELPAALRLRAASKRLHDVLRSVQAEAEKRRLRLPGCQLQLRH